MRKLEPLIMFFFVASFVEPPFSVFKYIVYYLNKAKDFVDELHYLFEIDDF